MVQCFGHPFDRSYIFYSADFLTILKFGNPLALAANTSALVWRNNWLKKSPSLKCIFTTITIDGRVIDIITMESIRSIINTDTIIISATITISIKHSFKLLALYDFILRDFWNCNGLGDPKKYKFISDLVAELGLDFVTLSETGRKDCSQTFPVGLFVAL